MISLIVKIGLVTLCGVIFLRHLAMLDYICNRIQHRKTAALIRGAIVGTGLLLIIFDAIEAARLINALRVVDLMPGSGA